MSNFPQLPNGWCDVSLEQLCKIRHGYAFKSKDFGMSGPIVLTPGNFTEDGELDFINKRIVRLSTKYGKEWVLKNGSLIVVMTDLSQQKKILGISTILNCSETVLHNQRIGLVIPLLDEISRSYIRYAINRSSFRKYIAKTSTGTLISHTSPSKLLQGSIPLPPLNEQRRIVAKIEELTAHSRKAREALDDVPRLIDRFRQSVLAAAFRGDLTADWREKNPDVEPAEELLERIRFERRQRWEDAELEKMRAKGKKPKNDKWKKKYKEPKEFEYPDGLSLPELPEGWLWMSVDTCTSWITDGEHATPERSDSGVYLLSARNVLDGKLSLEKVDFISEQVHQKLEERLKILPGDVLLSCSGTVGRSCVVPTGVEFSLVRSVAVLKPLLSMGGYLSLALRSPYLQAQIERKKTQTAQSNLFQGRIKVLAIPMPSIQEQQKILQIVEEAFEFIDKIERMVDEISDSNQFLNQSILAKAFRGELVPQDPNDEPASVLLDRIRTEREKLGTSKKKGRTSRRKTKQDRSQ